ncbi:hypothetical protein A9Q99_18330 [Gammaproteobacteria bacterium 45_16_T64]|nr:hypothetical protein A9Q99_18330 [Gammaproteobacteria bacterium 45_16_T64]
MFDNSDSLIKKRDHLNTLIEKKLREDKPTAKKNTGRKFALLGWLGITMAIDKTIRQGVLDSVAEFMPSESDKTLFKTSDISEISKNISVEAQG